MLNDLDVIASEDGLALLRRAWPTGIPSAEENLFAKLTTARRERVVARLRGLLQIEAMRAAAPGGRIDMAERAVVAGLTTDGLFAIRKRWEAERSLSSITPYLGRSERQATQRADDDAVVVAARALIAERPGEPDSVLASELRRFGGASLPNMIRLVRRLRRDDATNADRIGGTFGRAILIDLCAMDAVTPADPGSAIVCALVVERASGLVLGSAVAAADGDTLEAQRQAVVEAIDGMSDLRIDLDDGGGRAAVEMTIGDGAGSAAAFAAADASREAGFDVRANSRGPRRYGQRLVSLLGKRLGRLWWRPRATAPALQPVAGGSAMELSAASALVASEVSDHNREVLARLAEGGIVKGGGLQRGSMTSALHCALAILQGQVTP